MIEYFTFDLGSRTSGLIRRTRDEKASTIKTVQDSAWVDTPDALRYFEGFGGLQFDLVPLTEDEARPFAAELGVTLSDAGQHGELVSEHEIATLTDDALVALIVARSSGDRDVRLHCRVARLPAGGRKPRQSSP